MQTAASPSILCFAVRTSYRPEEKKRNVIVKIKIDYYKYAEFLKEKAVNMSNCPCHTNIILLRVSLYLNSYRNLIPYFVGLLQFLGVVWESSGSGS